MCLSMLIMNICFIMVSVFHIDSASTTFLESGCTNIQGINDEGGSSSPVYVLDSCSVCLVDSIIICGGERIIWFGQSIAQDGDYAHFVYSNGQCDTAFTLNVLVWSGTFVFTKEYNRSTKESRDTTIIYKNIDGCDSMIFLTIEPALRDKIFVTGISVTPIPNDDGVVVENVDRYIFLNGMPFNVNSDINKSWRGSMPNWMMFEGRLLA